MTIRPIYRHGIPADGCGAKWLNIRWYSFFFDEFFPGEFFDTNGATTVKSEFFSGYSRFTLVSSIKGVGVNKRVLVG